MTVGQALAAARLEAGLTLEQVSAATNIRRTVVAAMEDDDFSPCGGDFYARAHLRTVARALRTDPAPLLAIFDEQHAPAAQRPAEALPTSLERVRRGGPNWSAAMALMLVGVLAFGGYRVVARTEAPTVEVTAQAPARPAAAPAKVSPPSAPRPTPRDAVAQARRKGVDVRLAATSGPSWVSVTTGSGRQLFRGTLPRGRSRTFTDPARIKLIIGNAGAVALAVNGKQLGAPGRSGTVARVAFTPEDPAAG